MNAVSTDIRVVGDNVLSATAVQQSADRSPTLCLQLHSSVVRIKPALTTCSSAQACTAVHQGLKMCEKKLNN